MTAGTLLFFVVAGYCIYRARRADSKHCTIGDHRRDITYRGMVLGSYCDDDSHEKEALNWLFLGLGAGGLWFLGLFLA